MNFPLPPAARRIFRQAEVALVVEHPYERARALLTPATQTSLADDLEETRGGA